MKKEMWKLNKFGEKLAYALSLKGWSQQFLADKLGTTQQTISRWIKGQREPSIDDMLLICHFLDDEPNELLGYNDIEPEEFAQYDEIYENSEIRIEHIETQKLIDRDIERQEYFDKKQK